VSKPKPKTNKEHTPAPDYSVQTGLEANAMMCAVSDGKSGRHWENIEGADRRVHQVPGSAHRVQLVLSDGERELGFSFDLLQNATDHRDADDVFMLLYISRQLAPSQPLPPGAFSGAVVGLDDVIKAIGWYPQNRGQRAEMRRRVWHFIKFVARAHIIGQRTYKQRDKMTGEEIDTYIDSPPWMIGETVREGQPQPSLFEEDEPPLSVHIAATPIWTKLTALPETAQFLPLGEVLGAIPGGRAAGAWARVIGLALSNFWRRHPREVVIDTLKPTRRELIERYTPATGSIESVLNGPNPRRAVEYWAGALRILVECEFLAEEGEAALSYEAQRDALNGYKWQDDWLNGVADIRPGAAMIAAINSRANALPTPKPRNLTKSARKSK